MPRSPDPINTWYFQVNQTASEADDETMRAELLYMLKESWIGSGSWVGRDGAAVTAPSAWRVDHSCDGDTAGTPADNVDRWTANSRLVWGTEGTDAHSWVVLAHANFFGVGSPLYVLIDLSEATSATRNGTVGIYLSQAGFTGGTTIDRPTAADEAEVLQTNGTNASNSSGWQGQDANTVLAQRLHVMQSSDGTKVRAFICRNDETHAVWDLFHVDDADAAWSRPVLMMVLSEDSDEEHNTWNNGYNNASLGSRYHGYDAVQGAFIGEVGMPMYRGNGEHTDEPSSTFGSRIVPAPIPIRGSGSPVTGPLAYVPDAWWVSNSNGTGDTGTDDEANAESFAQFGDIMYDWCRTTPLVS